MISAKEKLNIRFKASEKALLRLDESIQDLIKIGLEDPIDERKVSTYRNSIVMLFSITYDVFWKYVKDYLWLIHGIEENSPKKVFRECFKSKLISQATTELFLDMVDDRNRLIHTYDEALGIKISYSIPNYFKKMKSLHAKLLPSEK